MCLNPFPVVVDEKYPYIEKKHKVTYLVPCRHCPECRTLRRLQWIFRMEQESLRHEFNYFITLTYSNEFLPKDGQIYKPDFQEFMKRLRRNHEYVFKNARISYYACGEYGDTYGRCHFHAILFCNHPLSSADINIAWKYGFIDFKPFTSTRAAYVVKYSQKSLWYYLPDDVQAPCSLCSNNLGSCYLTPSVKRYYKSTQFTDCFTLNGTKLPLPRYYYDRIFTKVERKQISMRKELERFRQEMRDYEECGLWSIRGKLANSQQKWQNAYNNFLYKPINDFTLYE